MLIYEMLSAIDFLLKQVMLLNVTTHSIRLFIVDSLSVYMVYGRTEMVENSKSCIYIWSL